MKKLTQVLLVLAILFIAFPSMAMAFVPPMTASVSIGGLMDSFLNAGLAADKLYAIPAVVIWMLILAFLAWFAGLLK